MKEYLQIIFTHHNAPIISILEEVIAGKIKRRSIVKWP